MKAIIKLAILLVIAVVIAIVINQADGYVQIAAWGWLASMSLLAALIYVVIAFAVLYLLIRLISNLGSLPQRMRDWVERRRMKNELSLFEKGWVMWLEGKSHLAERDLKKLRRKSNDKSRQAVASIAGAKFAAQAGNQTEADELIDKALAETQDHPQLHDAASTVKAEILIDRGEANRALPILNKLDSVNPNQMNILKLKLKAYQQTGLLRELVKVTRYLVKKKEIDPKTGTAIIEKSAAEIISDPSDELWVSFFDSLTDDEQHLPLVASAAADRFALGDDHKRSAKVLESAIKEKMDQALLRKYVTECPDDQIDSRLSNVQKWLNAEPVNTSLLNAAAYLCILNQMWGQAQRYLSKSLSLQDKVQTHALLGTLYDRMGRRQQASEHWRKSSGMKHLVELSADSTHYSDSADTAAQSSAEAGQAAYREDRRVESARGEKIFAKTHDFSVFSPRLAQDEDEQYFDSAPAPHLMQEAEYAKASELRLDRQAQEPAAAAKESVQKHPSAELPRRGTASGTGPQTGTSPSETIFSSQLQSKHPSAAESSQARAVSSNVETGIQTSSSGQPKSQAVPAASTPQAHRPERGGSAVEAKSTVIADSKTLSEPDQHKYPSQPKNK